MCVCVRILEIKTNNLEKLLLCQTVNGGSSGGWTLLMTQADPSPHNENQQGDYHLHLKHESALAWETRRHRRWTQIPSRCNNTPFPASALSWAALRRQRREREGKRGGGREGRKKLKDLFVSCSLCVSLSLSLLFSPLLNLTIKQHCKNRMFLAEAQQWQSREGKDHTLSRKKKSIFSAR